MLKKLVSILILSALLLPAAVSAQDVNNFRITSFEADYYLTRDENKTSQLDVSEKIVGEFPDFDQNHGIKRAIPKTYQGHTVSLKILSVKDANGKDINYSTSEENDNEVLKIGDADKYVRGQQTYNIKYQLKNVISFQESDEFFWDINGTEWLVPIDSVVGRIHLSADIAATKEERQVCYSGYSASTSTNCTVVTEPAGDGKLVTVSSLSPLSIGENISAVLGFTKGTFVMGPEVQAEKNRQKLLLILATASVVLPILATIILVTRRWQKYGRDPAARTAIAPEYIPPKGFNALTSDFILNERLKPQAVTAAILELAVSHYLVIHEIKKEKLFKDKTEFELEIIKDPSDLSAEQIKVVNEVFSNSTAVGSRVNLDVLKNKLHTTVSELDTSIGKMLAESGYFTKPPHEAKKQHMKIGGIMVALGFVGFFLIFTIPLAVGLTISGLIVLAVSSAMPARTEKGVEMRTYLEGLESYMKLAEADRLEFSQGLKTAERTEANPTDNAAKIKLFERLLPYAVLFGIDKDWAKEFGDLYSQPPSWYTGNASAFNAAYLASSIGSFSTAASTAFSAPSSSGGSGFSGGSSGGGGGGGGGGGW